MFSSFFALSQDIHVSMWNLTSKLYVYFHNNNNTCTPSPEIGKTKFCFFFCLKIIAFFFSFLRALLLLYYLTSDARQIKHLVYLLLMTNCNYARNNHDYNCTETTSIIINIILILTLDVLNEQLVSIIYMHEPQIGKSS